MGPKPPAPPPPGDPVPKERNQFDLFARPASKPAPAERPAPPPRGSLEPPLRAPSPIVPPAPPVRSANAPAAPAPTATAPTATARVVSVTELTRDLKGLLEPRFSRIAVRGELSNYRPASSGHHYFTLKDQGATIAAVLFRNEAVRLKFKLKDGLAVVCRGRVSVYEQRGQYQI
ncbi:MAG TPA: exodeoxyribonuclease VII large subunit, partial [Myxococcales bacterium]